MDLELSGTCYHDGPRTYDLDMGEIRCGQCGGLLAENADPCQECVAGLGGESVNGQV